MYLRLRGEKPRRSGNASRRSCESRSIVLAPQPSCSWRPRIALPISQYSNTIASLAADTTRNRSEQMRSLICPSRTV